MLHEEAAKKVVSQLPMVRPSLTRKRKNMALAFAGIVDFIQIIFFPFFIGGAVAPPDGVIDVIAAIVLLIMCGVRWQFGLVFVIELIPGLALFPTWTAFVLMLPVRDPQEQQAFPAEPSAATSQEPAAAPPATPPAPPREKQITVEVLRVGKPE